MLTRDKIVDTAFQLFYRNGFHAVGIDLISDEAGVTRQTLYNHFDSRDALILEVINRRDAWWRTEFKKLIRYRGGQDPLSQLRCIADVIRDWLSDNEFKGCLFICAAAEFPNPRDPVHRTAKRNLDAIRLTISDLAIAAGLDRPEVFAQNLALIIQGAIVTEVIDRENQCGSRLCVLSELLINSHTR